MKNKIEIREFIEKIKKEAEEDCIVLNTSKNMLLSLGKCLYQDKNTMFLLVSTKDFNDIDYHYFSEIDLSKNVTLENEVKMVNDKYQEFVYNRLINMDYGDKDMIIKVYNYIADKAVGLINYHLEMVNENWNKWKANGFKPSEE